MIFYGSRNALSVTGLINDTFLTEKSRYSFYKLVTGKKKKTVTRSHLCSVNKIALDWSLSSKAMIYKIPSYFFLITGFRISESFFNQVSLYTDAVLFFFSFFSKTTASEASARERKIKYIFFFPHHYPLRRQPINPLLFIFYHPTDFEEKIEGLWTTPRYKRSSIPYWDQINRLE